MTPEEAVAWLDERERCHVCAGEGRVSFGGRWYCRDHWREMDATRPIFHRT